VLICGVDDAGRGAVIGPLVVAGVLIDSAKIHLLENLGVKDSKALSPKRRRELAEKIIKIAEDYYVVKVEPEEIDRVVKHGKKLNKLNRLEAKVMAEVIRRLRPTVAYVDASDVIPERFKNHILEEVPFDVKIVSRHKADVIYPVVSAASIIAKVERDKAIMELCNRYGEIGSGYSSDSRTRKFLADWLLKHGSYPPFARKTWKTLRRIREVTDSGQKKLFG